MKNMELGDWLFEIEKAFIAGIEAQRQRPGLRMSDALIEATGYASELAAEIDDGSDEESADV